VRELNTKKEDTPEIGWYEEGAREIWMLSLAATQKKSSNRHEFYPVNKGCPCSYWGVALAPGAASLETLGTWEINTQTVALN
jgi:hypothetical protein